MVRSVHQSPAAQQEKLIARQQHMLRTLGFDELVSVLALTPVEDSFVAAPEPYPLHLSHKLVRKITKSARREFRKQHGKPSLPHLVFIEELRKRAEHFVEPFVREVGRYTALKARDAFEKQSLMDGLKG